MYKLNIGEDLYLKGRIGWRGLSKDEYLENGSYRIINATSLEDKLINWKICGYISKDRYEESKEIQLKEKDILISKDGTLGKIGYVKNLDQPSTVASGIFVLRNIIEDKLDTDYLYHFLKSNIFKDFIKKRKASGSTIHHLYQRDLSQFEINLPEISKQKKISAILNVIDSKIELNNRINAELEAMAKTLYDYWFVQFDFPNEHGKPYKSSGGKMVYNKELKREIPEGWEVGTIKDYCPSTGGFAFKSSWWTNHGVSVIKIKDIREDYTIDITNLAKVDLSNKKVEDKFKTKPGDILIAMTGATVGKYGIVPKTDFPIYVNQRVGCFNLGNDPTEKLPYFINSLNQPYFRSTIFLLASGAAQPNISNEQINNISLLIPNNEIVEKFNNKFAPFYNRILNNQSQNQHLASLRDWLLPMLMNGQVTVKEAEGRVGETFGIAVESQRMAAEPEGKYSDSKKT